VTEADGDDLYAVMDWLVGRQRTIEKKLAPRYLGEGRPGALRRELGLQSRRHLATLASATPEQAAVSARQMTS